MSHDYFIDVVLPTIVMVVLAGLFVLGIWSQREQAFKEGYKQGQVDSLNGKIKYELKKNDDGEIVYTEIENTTP